MGGLRHADLVCEFRETERWWRMESGFVFFRKIQVEEEECVKGDVPKRARRLAE
jgi:hypothetical protein